ncbi:MAG: iron-sulfur cluster carrier protein MrpORP [Desulfitobacteriia bacterium]|jgi:Mrp family chromosome partitioning ATPase/predicted Fe-Mo cluster-binding NifX family protein
MSENSQGCKTCASDHSAKDFTFPNNERNKIKKVIGIMSGKGGVGKSLVTSLMAVAMNKRGYETAILDADITGPSIPKAFGVTKMLGGSEEGMLPARSKRGLQIMSINLLLENETDPVIWRGPILSGVIKQFWSDVVWGEVDFMFIDMPPGTGDVPLTVFQSIKLDGLVIVASPQELVSMIVAKAVKMARQMQIPILGLVENMAYFQCPQCGGKYNIFGESALEEVAAQYQLRVLARLPIDPKISEACDKGQIEFYEEDWLANAADILEGLAGKKVKRFIKGGNSEMKIAVASDGEMVAEHFGHCEEFNIFETGNGQVLKNETIPNPGHRPGFLPNFLNDMGVKVVISGGMGGGAIDIFNEKGIEVITGVTGKAKTAVEEYLQGNLKSSGSVCNQHQHLGECGGH